MKFMLVNLSANKAGVESCIRSSEISSIRVKRNVVDIDRVDFSIIINDDISFYTVTVDSSTVSSLKIDFLDISKDKLFNHALSITHDILCMMVGDIVSLIGFEINDRSLPLDSIVETVCGNGIVYACSGAIAIPTDDEMYQILVDILGRITNVSNSYIA